MSKLIKVVVLSVCGGVLTGCSLTNQVHPTSASEPVKIEVFSGSHSIAYNMANQTDLTKDYAYGGRIYKSPLRDFTEQEIVETKAKLDNAINGGSAAKVFGALKVLTGNLTGIIDIAGGVATDLSSSSDKHPAITSRWIVSVDASKYKNALEAKKDIANTIQSAVLSEYEKYGIEVRESSSGELALYSSKMFDGKYVDLGGLHHIDQSGEKVEPIIKQVVNFSGLELESYSVGLRNSDRYDTLINPVGFSLFLYRDATGNDSYDDFMKKVTARLPKNYLYYQVSFPKYTYDNKSYVETSIITPAIYTQGKRYDFLKPEAK